MTNRPPKQLKLKAEKSSKIQRLLKEKRAKQRRRTISEPVYDEAYFEAMQAMDDEDIEISDQVKISPETADAISQQTEAEYYEAVASDGIGLDSEFD